MTTGTPARLPVFRPWLGVIAAIAVVLLASLVFPPATAQQKKPLEPQSAESRQYTACMTLARRNPTAAHESALAWRKKGGGDAALHCIAVALLGLGEYGQAGQMMEELASRTRPKTARPKSGAAGPGRQCVADFRPATAHREALEHRPGPGSQGRGIAHRPQYRPGLPWGNIWDALDDLNDALEFDPGRVDALTFRASAWRHVDALELAETDIDAALKQRPDFPDGLLERGLIRKAQGNKAGARTDWLRVIEIAVEGPLTETARRYLESMDVKKP